MDAMQEASEILEAIDRGWLQCFGNTLLYRCADGECLCGTCVVENREQLKDATLAYFTRESREPYCAIVGVESAAEYDEPQQCAHCNKVMQ